MRRRRPLFDASEPPPIPDLGPRPLCTAKARGGFGRDARVIQRPCTNCPIVTEYNDAVESYHAALTEWRDTMDDRTPLEIVELVTERRRQGPDLAWCWAVI